MKKGDFVEFAMVWDQKERGFAEFAMVGDEQGKTYRICKGLKQRNRRDSKLKKGGICGGLAAKRWNLQNLQGLGTNKEKLQNLQGFE